MCLLASHRGLPGGLLLLLGLLVSACSSAAVGGFTADGSVELSRQSPYGLVVVGIRTREETPQISTLGLKSSSSVELTWRQFDYESDRVLFARNLYSGRYQITTGRYRCYLYRNHPGCQDEDYTSVQYNLLRVQPGHYLFQSMRVGSNRDVALLPRHQGFLHEGSATATYELGLLPGFEIAAGEIVYIGDYVVSVTGERPRLVGLGSTPDGARQALAAYPNVDGEMRLQKLPARVMLPGG